MFFSPLIFSQNMYLTEHPVYLDITKQYIYVFCKKDSSIRTNYGDQDTTLIKVFELTPKGALKFIFKDTTSNIVIKGQYKEAPKLSTPQDYSRNGTRVRTKSNTIAQPYYHSLRDGVWYYYRNGCLIKSETY